MVIDRLWKNSYLLLLWACCFVSCGEDLPQVELAATAIDPQTMVTGGSLAITFEGIVKSGAPSDTPLTVTLVGSIENGYVDVDSGDAPLVVTYTPKANFLGKESIIYRVTDNKGNASPTETVWITVEPVNDPPSATGALVSCPLNQSVTITLTGSDPESAPLIFMLDDLLPPSHGTLGQLITIDDSSAQVIYTPNQDYSGVDSFSFSVSDSKYQSPLATIILQVG